MNDDDPSNTTRRRKEPPNAMRCRLQADILAIAELDSAVAKEIRTGGSAVYFEFKTNGVRGILTSVIRHLRLVAIAIGFFNKRISALSRSPEPAAIVFYRIASCNRRIAIGRPVRSPRRRDETGCVNNDLAKGLWKQQGRKPGRQRRRGQDAKKSV